MDKVLTIRLVDGVVLINSNDDLTQEDYKLLAKEFETRIAAHRREVNPWIFGPHAIPDFNIISDKFKEGNGKKFEVT